VSHGAERSEQQEKGGVVSRRVFVAGAAGAAAASMVHGGRVTLGAAEAPAGAIPKRTFGATGVEISAVGLGAGSRFYSSVPDDEQAAELVRRAIDMGIEFMETSANYGPDGMSEKRLGLAMKTHRAKVFLETKVDDRTYDGAMREMERSLQRLNTDHFDLVLHHNMGADDLDAVAARNGAERALREMVDQKVARFRGLSTHYPEVAMRAMEVLQPQAMQHPINAVRVPDFEPEVLPTARERGVAIIAMKTCGHGYFLKGNVTTPDRVDQYGAPPGALDRWDLPTYRDYIHYALSLPIAAATIGIDSHFTLEGIVAAATDFAPLTAERMASITRRAQVFTTTGYWVPRNG
jgi:aryl-alcohol dehydrogenase-like predicted oxidoreductase